MSADAPDPPLRLPFTAYLRAPHRRWLRSALLGTAVLVGAFGWFAARRGPTLHTLATSQGMRTLKDGMSREDVRLQLGPPRSASAKGTRECSVYGSPTFAGEGFPMYEVCYDAQRLVGVTVRQFNATPVVPGEPPEHN